MSNLTKNGSFRRRYQTWISPNTIGAFRCPTKRMLEAGNDVTSCTWSATESEMFNSYILNWDKAKAVASKIIQQFNQKISSEQHLSKILLHLQSEMDHTQCHHQKFENSYAVHGLVIKTGKQRLNPRNANVTRSVFGGGGQFHIHKKWRAQQQRLALMCWTW